MSYQVLIELPSLIRCVLFGHSNQEVIELILSAKDSVQLCSMRILTPF